MSSQSDAVEKTKFWAAQSIAFAICLNTDTTGKTVKPEFFALAHKEAEATAFDLWKETFAETGPNVPADVIIMKVTQKVFDWCYSHMNPEK